MTNFSSEEIHTIRADTPGTRNVVHFNNAGASLMPQVVWTKMNEYLQHELNHGGYETAEKYSGEIESVYSNLAAYLNCEPSEIAITENATAAWDQAFLSIPLKPGDCILTSVAEYASNFIPFLQMKKRIGVQVTPIPNDRYGQIDLTALSRMLQEKVKLIAVTHVPTNGGLVNPAREIGDLAKKHNVWYLLDACQSVGQMPMDVKSLGCDFLSATGRKYLRGPRGVGFLYASREKTSQLEPFIMDLHGAQWKSRDSYEPRNDARKFENWECNYSGVVGLSVAVDYMIRLGIDRIWARIQGLADYLRKQLLTLPEVAVQDLGKVKCGIVSFTSPIIASELKAQLHQSGFNVSVIHPSHTLLDMQDRGLGYMIRASVHYYNTEEEVDRFVECLAELL